MRHSILLISCLLCVTYALLPNGYTEAQEQCTVSSPSKTTVICLAQRRPLLERVAWKLQEYLAQRTGRRPVIAASGDIPLSTVDAPVIAVGWPDELDVKDAFGPAPDFSGSTNESYVLRVRSSPGLDCRVLVAGKTDAGTKYAVYDLMRRARTTGDEVRMVSGEWSAKPFFGVRRAILGIPTLGEGRYEDQLRYCFENWTVPEVEDYVDVLDFMGYNSIEYSITPARFTWTGNFISLDDLCKRYEAISARAHENGMTVSLFFWGHIFPVQTEGKVELLQLMPSIPSQRNQIPEHYRRWMARLGPFVDHVHMHWVDPGGDADSTVEAPQQLTRQMVEIVNSLGLDVSVSFSLWMLHLGAWPGYEGPDTVLDSGILPRGMEIALPGARYQADLVKRIKEKGYTPALWAWYFFDMETVPGLHYHGEIMDRDFALLPPEAGDLLAWHTGDSVHHRMNLPTLYVGARKLWDPGRPARELLREFCTGVYGDTYGEDVAQGFEALGQARCGARCWGEPGTPGGPFFGPVNPQNVTCALGLGSDDIEGTLRQVRDVLQRIERAHADPTHIPRIPLTIEPQALVLELCEHLRYVEAFYRLRGIVRDAESARAKGLSRTDIEHLVREGLAIEPPPLTLSWGTTEAAEISALRTRLQSISERPSE